MKTSQLVKALQDIIANYGDGEVACINTEFLTIPLKPRLRVNPENGCVAIDPQDWYLQWNGHDFEASNADEDLEENYDTLKLVTVRD